LRYSGWHRRRTVLAEITNLGLWCLRGRLFNGNQNQLPTALFQHPLHRRREVDEEVEAIGDLLRLRQYGDSWVLTHKAKMKNDSGRYKTRAEIETRVEDGLKMEAILRDLQFTPSFRYEKFRAEWRGEQGHVVIDETPIGNFVEIEGPGEWIDQLARLLGIGSDQYIRDTYAGLFFAWKQATRSLAQEMTFAAVRAS